MTTVLILKAAVVWVGIACLAIGNGVIREEIIAPIYGDIIALPLSGIALSLIVFVVAFFTFNFIGIRESNKCIYVGFQWVIMTLAFEFLFGHFVAGKSWLDVLQVFNVAKGNLFTLVLVVSLLSPYAVARIKGTL